MAKGQYYLGRVVKINLDQKRLMDAITNAPVVTIGKFDWTLTDIEDKREKESPYIFGKMSKYAVDGQAKVIDETRRSQVDTDVPNLVVSSSPFVYLPECSGIAFLHVSNGIEANVFSKRFKSIIETAFDNFFVECHVEPISDYRAFTSRLKNLDKFTEISATVSPPNPLFGRLWESLNEYIQNRNASEVTVKEKGEESKGIKSEIITLMEKIISSRDYEPEKVPDIGDAAILMAADGYGSGKVTGIEKGEKVTIRTSDAQKNFQYFREPNPDDLDPAPIKESSYSYGNAIHNWLFFIGGICHVKENIFPGSDHFQAA